MTPREQYTATTSQVKEAYSLRGRIDEPEIQGEKGWEAQYRRAEEFDRWLAEHDKQVAAKAWDEGCEFNMRLWEDGSYANPINPYRATAKSGEAEPISDAAMGSES